MAKRLFSWMLVLALILSMIPAITLGITAEEALDEHTSHEGWTEWTDSTKLPTAAGKYYLSVDVNLTAAWTVPNGDTHLCLNGHHIKQTANTRVISVGTGNSLSIYDCAKAYEGETYVGGTISGGKSNDFGHGIWMGRGTTNENGAVLNLYGGRICGNKYSGVANARGGAVYMQSSQVGKGGPKLNMYGGEMYDNQASLGGAVFMHAESSSANRGTVPPEFNMYGGKIHGNTTSTYKDSANATVGGTGTIYAIGNAIVNIQGGEISDNTTESHGSVVFADNSAKITVKNAKITGNESKGTGGIYTKNYVELTVENTEISGNHAPNAPAIYGQNYVKIGLKDTVVTGNSSTSTSAEGYGAAIYLCGSTSKITISGKTTIAHNVMKNAAIADLFINSSSGSDIEKLYVKNLEGGYVKFGIKDKAASVAEASDVIFFEGAASAYSDGAVSYMAGTTEKHVGLVDGSFKFIEGHFHEGVKYEKWTNGAKVPSSGNYYLDTDIKVGTKATVDGGVTLRLCMNGHTIDGQGKTGDLLRVSNGSAYISDCTTVYDADGYFVSGGKFVNGLRKGNGAALYVNKATSVLEVTGVAFEGNKSTETSEGYGGGAFQARLNTTPVKFIGCKFADNESACGGGAIALRENGRVYLEKTIFENNVSATNGGAIYSTSGHFTAKDCKFTGNSAKSSGAVNVTMASTATVEGCTFTGNTSNDVTCIGILGTTKITIKDSTFTGNPSKGAWYGAVNLSNGDAVAKLVGKVIIDGNPNKDGKPVNLHLQDGDTKDFDFSGLGEGSKIGVTLHHKRVDAGEMFFSTTGMTAVPAGVTSDNDTYEVYVDDQGRLALKEKGGSVTPPPVVEGHTHKLCNDASCTSHGDAITFEAWEKTDSLPTAGNYYLVNDVKLTAAVETTGALNLCLNGKTVTAASGKRILSVKIGTTTSVTDCGTTGKLTGGGATYGSAISIRHASIFNLFGGKITGNSSTSEGTVYLQGGKVDATNNYPVAGTFNMYGGEISGNTTKIGAAISVGAPTGAVTTNAAVNIYGGKITGNTTTGRGGAINASGKAVIYIENAEISGNNAAGEGTIYATSGAEITVKNAKIKNNNANNGAAISTYGGKLTLDGAVIENNHATGGYSAVHAAVSGAVGAPVVTLKGATVITGNTNGDAKTPMNLCLRTTVAVDVSGLTDAAQIGLYRMADRTVERISTKALGSANELNRFTSDKSEDYAVAQDAEGYLILKEAGPAHAHKLCNDAACADHSNVTFQPWTDATKLPTKGNYYLDVDVKLTAVSYAEGDLVLCLNGHTIKQTAKARVLQTKEGGSLTITDCGTTGTITGGVNDTGASIFVTDGTTFNLYAGKITGSAPASAGKATSGSAIFLRSGSGAGATFNMYGGEITGNGDDKSWAGAIGNGSGNANNCVYLNIYGGKIYGNAAGTGGAIRMERKSVTTIYGGEIYGNEAATNGGAIYLSTGNPELIIKGGKIYDNTAAGGGAIYASAGAKITIEGDPTIYNNTASDKQNNLYLAGNDKITLGELATTAKIGINAANHNRAISTTADADYSANFLPDNSKLTVSYKEKALWLEKIEVSDHYHAVCADVVHGTCEHDKNQMWIKWGDDAEELTSLPTASGCYYLVADITLTGEFVIGLDQNVSLCLNGKTVTQTAKDKRHYASNTRAILNITDCSENVGGFTGGNRSYGGSINVVAGSTVNLFAGKIYGNTSNEGGGVYLQAAKLNGDTHVPGGIFNMYGGEISGNKATTNGGGIKAAGIGGAATKDPSIVNIYGGKVCGNEAKGVEKVDATTGEVTYGNASGGGIAASYQTPVTIYGGTICDNTANYQGGGIYLSDKADLYIKGGKIEGNEATSVGGGIFATGNGTEIILDSGEITGNKSANGGGMITQTQSKFIMNGGKISGNESTSNGAGIYVSTNTDFIMNGGEISGNKAGSNGAGFFALRSRVTLDGGAQIIDNVAANRAGAFAASGATMVINKVTIKGNSAKEGGVAYINRTSSGSGDAIKYYPSVVEINDGALITENKAETNSGGLLIANDDVVVTMNGGELSKNVGANGGSVMTWRGSTFIMKGGKIVNNTIKGSGGGVYVSTASTFKMEGGTIANNTAKSAGGVYFLRCNAELSGGSISNNTAKHTSTWKDGKETKSGGTGGGMYISGAKVNFRGTSITGNYATVNGGAIMMGRASYTENGVKKVDNVTVNVYGGLFSGNKTDGAGGAMLIQSEFTVVNVYGGTFTNNKAKNAGAIYVSTKTNFNMSGGVFTRNHADASGGALYFLKSTGKVTGGQIYNNTATTSAGGVMINGDICNVTFKNIKFHDHESKSGGCVVGQSYSHANFINCDFYDNNATSTGGGLYISNNSYADFTDCKLYNNTSTNASGAIHAAINSKLNITNCDFTENVAGTMGGAMYTNPKCVIDIKNSTFSKNKAATTGGALVCRATMYLTNVTLENNTAENGGAVATDSNNTGGAGVRDGLIVKNSQIRNNTASGQGGAFYIWKGRPLHLYDSKISGNTAGLEGGAIWSYEDVQLHDTTITGNTSGGEGYAVYMNDANYDGHSYYTSKNKLSGNVIIKENQGGDLWMGPDVVFAITPDGLGENVHIEVTLDSGVLTQRVLGAYHYEGGKQVYTITYGDKSMTDPEVDPTLVVEKDDAQSGTNTDQKTAGDIWLYVGIGIFAALIIAVGVILVMKKKKAGKTADKASKE